MAKMKNKKGSALVLVVVAGVILMILGVALLSASYGARLNSIRFKNETAAMLAAEAGYEKAIFWMSEQADLLYKIKNVGAHTDSITFDDGASCQYIVNFYSFIGAKPIYKIVSQGSMGRASRNVEVLVVQAIGGWEMGMCRVPNGRYSTTPVNFVDGEIIDMPIHINCYNTKKDNAIDIHIIGNPDFQRYVSMGEARYSSGGSDKYSSVMDSFNGGIDFEQPDNPINVEEVISDKIESFASNTKTDYQISPSVSVPSGYERAVQLEFFVESGQGKVRIANNCIVDVESPNTYDYKTRPGTNGSEFEKYNIYGTHYVDPGQVQVVNVEDTYVTQQIGSTTSEPGGQIYIDGNVIIGGNRADNYGAQEVLGNMTVVATGNIWIADSIYLSGNHDSSNNNLPSHNNPNALGLMSKGVVKVVDPGETNPINPANYPQYSSYRYEPIGITKSTNPNSTDRYLPDTTVIEAAITVGGGGFGAENVGSRKEYSGNQDNLVLHGTLTEVVRGVVGLTNSDGYIKKYYLDERMLQGILPGDMWLKRKYVPAPAGWVDYRPDN